MSKSHEKPVILKKISFSSISPKKKEHIVNEVNTLIRMDYIHILRYIDYQINKKDITVDIVMEYCQGGSLLDLIAKSKSEGKKISEEEIWRIFYQLAQAIEYIHADLIIHRNINPSNVYFA
jgi:NIMA (never in mitosis gene a)-related kinase